MSLHQAEVIYSSGNRGMFFSTDGWWFYEHQLPNPNPPPGSWEPFCYARSWLEGVARRSPAIASIDFIEVSA